jgi:coenzyme F420-reducing hydrogenase delta subunit
VSVETIEGTPADTEAQAAATAWEPKVLAILCNWCSYAGADFAGSSRLQYPANVRVVRVPCSGRVDPMYVVRGFERGADAVLVAGCHPGDCHYAKGNYYARRRLSVLKRLLAFVGIEPARFRAHWISASEGPEFAEVIRKIVAEVQPLGPWRGGKGEGRR